MVRSRTVPARGDPQAPRCDLLAARLPDLRATLVRQRDFRREQLAQLAQHNQHGRASTPHASQVADGDSGPPMRVVSALVEVGARHALDDIELALARIATGDYGRCRACGADIRLAVSKRFPGPPCVSPATGCARAPRVRFRSFVVCRRSPHDRWIESAWWGRCSLRPLHLRACGARCDAPRTPDPGGGTWTPPTMPVGKRRGRSGGRPRTPPPHCQEPAGRSAANVWSR
jgi:RNA polymerase-binding transcription factor DksA